MYLREEGCFRQNTGDVWSQPQPCWFICWKFMKLSFCFRSYEGYLKKKRNVNILLNEQKQDKAGQVPNLLEVEWICLVKRMKELPKYICHDYFWAMNPMDILLTISIVFQAFCNFLKIMSTTPFRPKKPVYPRAKDIFIYKNSAKWRESCFYRMFHSSSLLLGLDSHLRLLQLPYWPYLDHLQWS